MPTPRRPEPGNFIRREMNSVREPSSVIQPTDLFEVIQRAGSEHFGTERIFIFGFCKMRMQADIPVGGERRRIGHYLARY